jgi:peptidyl-prolyl cis-trans isomerase C
MTITRVTLQTSAFFLVGLVSCVAMAQSPTKPNPNPNTTTNQTYLTVNGKIIPKARADLLASMLPSPKKPGDAEAMRKTLGDELVRRELAAQEASKRGIDTRPEVRAQIDMAIQGVLVNAYLADYLREHPVTDELIRREYESIRSALGTKEYKARHIVLGSAADAQAVIDKLGRGTKFSDLAAQSQDRLTKDHGGDLGWINAATYMRPFSEALTKLQKGAHTLKPVQTDFGWHVILLDDVRDLKVPTLAEVKPQLLPRLQQKIIERHFSELRTRAKIE